jgi:hypothetical protein
VLKALRRSFRSGDPRSRTDCGGGERQQREAELIRKATEYRRLAAKLLKQANALGSPQDRDDALKAALRWQMLAEEAERTKLKLAHDCPKRLF